MNELEIDLFKGFTAHETFIVRCITTNGVLDSQGRNVMGKGVALQAKEKSPTLPAIFGAGITLYGNHVYWPNENPSFLSFPTKNHWRDPSNTLLIARSCCELATLARKFDHFTFYLPRPGCGVGGLKWSDVSKICSEWFEGVNNVYVVNNGSSN